MRMSDFVVREAIIENLAGSTKEAVIREMVESLARTGRVRGDTEDVARAILARERLGSTGIGRGVALPHAKHGSVEDFVATLAVSHRGVPFDSLDNQPAFLFVLLISPPDRPGPHLRALESISWCLRNDDFVRSVRTAKSRDEIAALVASTGP